MEYSYSKTDLLRHPQKYQKTPFFGLDFLKAYKNSRLSKISSLKVDPFSLNEFLSSISTNFKDNSDFFLKDFLSHLLIMSQKKSDFNTVTKHLNLLLKKFEIKKKIFVKYDSSFKEIDENFSYLRNYLLLSLLFEIQYEKSLSLKHLNSCLKINDTISSQKIEFEEDKILFKYLLEKELEFVKNLCEKKGIEF